MGRTHLPKKSSLQCAFDLKDRSIEYFNDLIKQMKLLPEAEKKLLNNVCKIFKILAVNPASISTAERTFSFARRVKTWMRSTMLPSRFNSVSILHFTYGSYR